MSAILTRIRQLFYPKYELAENESNVKLTSQKFGLVFWLSLTWIMLITFAAIFADFLPIADPMESDLNKKYLDLFSGEHWLGTDTIGRDMLSRMIYGGQISLTIAYTAPIISLVFGLAFGMAAGYFGGRTDTVIGIFVDSLLAFPNIVAVMAVLFVLGANLFNMILVLGFFGMVNDIRVSRAVTIQYRNRQFVTTARAQGASHLRILIRELLPNVIIPVLALTLIAMSRVVIIEGALAFLGVGLPPPTPSWGKMIADGFSEIGYKPHVTFIPSAWMFLTILSLNLIGDKLRSMTDPRTGNA
jgi:peptide/nickel transport system permease protein